MTPAVTIAHGCTASRDHSEVADAPLARRPAMAFGSQVACGAGTMADIFRTLGRVVFTRSARCKAKRGAGALPSECGARTRWINGNRPVRRSVQLTWHPVIRAYIR